MQQLCHGAAVPENQNLTFFLPFSIRIFEWIFYSSRNLKLVFFNKREEDILWYDQLHSLAEKSDRCVQKYYWGFMVMGMVIDFRGFNENHNLKNTEICEQWSHQYNVHVLLEIAL